MSLTKREQMHLAFDLAKALHALNNRSQKSVPENQLIAERALARWFKPDGRRQPVDPTALHCVTIGRRREDGDLNVFATLNFDSMGGCGRCSCDTMVETIRHLIATSTGHDLDEIIALERQDAPDVVATE